MTAAEPMDGQPIPPAAPSSGPAPSRPAGLRDMAIRVVTALAIGIVLLAAIIFGREIWLGAVVSLISMFAVAEFYAMTRRANRLPNEIFGLLATGAMPLAAAMWGMVGATSVVTALVVLSLVWHLVFRRVTTTDTAVTVFGAVYVGFMLSHLVLMRRLDSGTMLVLATVISVWANDVFAYLVGSTLGRHRMAPTISPRKSWEGFAAGTVFTILVWLLVFLAPTGLPLWWHAIIGAAVSTAAVVGDLAESRLKREAGIKDSGTLLPGHGGFLDRFDSLIFVSVVAYYLLVWAGAK